MPGTVLDKSVLWLEYSRLRPKEFDGYWGDCMCPTCRAYREAFEKWAAEQEATRKETTK